MTLRYIPWAAMDMVALMERIPDLREGAGSMRSRKRLWVRCRVHAFEEDLLAVGDIKAILSRSLRVGEMTLTQSHDGDLFNAYRPGLWQHLRDKFPTQVKLELLTEELLGDTETPSAHIAKTLKIGGLSWEMARRRMQSREPCSGGV